MARARIQLRNAASFSGLGISKPWRKNEVRVSADQAEIAYYQSQSEFVVTELVDKPAAQPKPVAPPEPADDNDDEPQKLTRSALARFSKPELVAYASATFGLALDGDLIKDDLISAILEIQG